MAAGRGVVGAQGELLGNEAQEAGGPGVGAWIAFLQWTRITAIADAGFSLARSLNKQFYLFSIFPIKDASFCLNWK